MPRHPRQLCAARLRIERAFDNLGRRPDGVWPLSKLLLGQLDAVDWTF